MTEISFRDRVAIVTGGARGLGAAYCQELARRGAAIVVHDNGADTSGHGHDPAPAHDLAAAIMADGGRAVACASDASTEDGGRAAVDLAIREFGRLDVIVANAGIIHDDSLEDLPTERFESLLRHHLLAAFHVVRPGFAVMKRAGYGRLVFVSSAAGIFGQPGLTGYATAKTGMLGLMNVAALEGAQFGITANAIMPMAGTRMAVALMREAAETADGRAFLDTLRVDQVAPSSRTWRVTLAPNAHGAQRVSRPGRSTPDRCHSRLDQFDRPSERRGRRGTSVRDHRSRRSSGTWFDIRRDGNRYDEFAMTIDIACAVPYDGLAALSYRYASLGRS